MELQPIQSKIYEIRGQRVMLDFDLAELYQVETKRLKEAVRRNIERFEGDDFMFVLSEKEYEILHDFARQSSLEVYRSLPWQKKVPRMEISYTNRMQRCSGN